VDSYFTIDGVYFSSEHVVDSCEMCVYVCTCMLCVPRMELDQVISCSHGRTIGHMALFRGLSPSKTVTCIKTCGTNIHCSSPFNSEQFLIFLFVITIKFFPTEENQESSVSTVTSNGQEQRVFSLLNFTERLWVLLSPCLVFTRGSFLKSKVAGT
jgi:hypothetical protein